MASSFSRLYFGLSIAVFSAIVYAATYQYTAVTTSTVSKTGVVIASGINWNCAGTQCTTSGPWPTPGVSACKSLAQQVGPIKSYGHPQQQLGAGDLAQCNTGVGAVLAPVVKSLAVMPTVSTPAPAQLKSPAGFAAVPSALQAPAPSPVIPASAKPAGFTAPSASAEEKPAAISNTSVAKLPVKILPASAPAPAMAKTFGLAVPSSSKSGVPSSTTATTSSATSAPHGFAVLAQAAPKTPLNPALQNVYSHRLQAFNLLQQQREQAEAAARRRADELRNASPRGSDCDDTRADVHPGAAEICDGRDNNCDGIVDEGQTTRRYLDRDGDGHGDPSTGIDVCPYDITAAARSAEQGLGGWLVEVGNDCNDNDPEHWHDC